MKSIFVLFLVLFNLTAYASDSGAWMEISDVEALNLISHNYDSRVLNRFPQEGNLLALGGRRGLSAKEAWISKLCHFKLSEPCVPPDSYQDGFEAKFIKENTSRSSNADVYGLYYLSENSNDLHYQGYHNRASFYQFTKIMNVRAIGRNGKLKLIEFVNSDGLGLTVSIKKGKLSFTYEFGEKTYSFNARFRGKASISHEIGELILTPFMFLIMH